MLTAMPKWHSRPLGDPLDILSAELPFVDKARNKLGL